MFAKLRVRRDIRAVDMETIHFRGRVSDQLWYSSAETFQMPFRGIGDGVYCII